MSDKFDQASSITPRSSHQKTQIRSSVVTKSSDSKQSRTGSSHLIRNVRTVAPQRQNKNQKVPEPDSQLEGSPIITGPNIQYDFDENITDPFKTRQNLQRTSTKMQVNNNSYSPQSSQGKSYQQQYSPSSVKGSMPPIQIAPLIQNPDKQVKTPTRAGGVFKSGKKSMPVEGYYLHTSRQENSPKRIQKDIISFAAPESRQSNLEEKPQAHSSMNVWNHSNQSQMRNNHHHFHQDIFGNYQEEDRLTGRASNQNNKMDPSSIVSGQGDVQPSEVDTNISDSPRGSLPHLQEPKLQAYNVKRRVINQPPPPFDNKRSIISSRNGSDGALQKPKLDNQNRQSNSNESLAYVDLKPNQKTQSNVLDYRSQFEQQMAEARKQNLELNRRYQEQMSELRAQQRELKSYKEQVQGEIYSTQRIQELQKRKADQILQVARQQEIFRIPQSYTQRNQQIQLTALSGIDNNFDRQANLINRTPLKQRLRETTQKNHISARPHHTYTTQPNQLSYAQQTQNIEYRYPSNNLEVQSRFLPKPQGLQNPHNDFIPDIAPVNSHLYQNKIPNFKHEAANLLEIELLTDRATNDGKQAEQKTRHIQILESHFSDTHQTSPTNQTTRTTTTDRYEESQNIRNLTEQLQDVKIPILSKISLQKQLNAANNHNAQGNRRWLSSIGQSTFK